MSRLSQERSPILQDTMRLEVKLTQVHDFEGLANINNAHPPDTKVDIGYDPPTGQKVLYAVS